MAFVSEPAVPALQRRPEEGIRCRPAQAVADSDLVEADALRIARR